MLQVCARDAAGNETCGELLDPTVDGGNSRADGEAGQRPDDAGPDASAGGCSMASDDRAPAGGLMLLLGLLAFRRRPRVIDA